MTTQYKITRADITADASQNREHSWNADGFCRYCDNVHRQDHNARSTCSDGFTCRGPAKPTNAQAASTHTSGHIEGDGTKMQLYVRSMGKLLAVTALFNNDDKANAYMENHKDEGCVATGSGLVFLANLYDRGARAELPIPTDKTRLFIAAAPETAAERDRLKQEQQNVETIETIWANRLTLALRQRDQAREQVKTLLKKFKTAFSTVERMFPNDVNNWAAKLRDDMRAAIASVESEQAK